MVQLTTAGLPPNFLHLARFDFSVRITVAFLLVIIVAALGRPIRMDVRIKSPVWNVESFDGVCERGILEFVGSKPAAAIPAANGIARLAFTELHRQQVFRTKGLLDLLVRDERGRAAEIAALTDS